MKRLTVSLLALAGLPFLGSVNAQEVFNETFTGYNPSPATLVGQGSWTQLGASVVNPYQVSASGAVPMANNGQDAQKTFSSQVPVVAGNSLITEFDVTVSTAVTGDFFAHITSPETGSAFYNRVYAQTIAGGFALGLSAGTPIAGNGPFYGTVLTLDQPHHVVTTWSMVDGAANDKFSMSVDGVPYVSEFTWNATVAEPTALALFNLRQGAAASSPIIAGIDNLVVTSVPEPSVAALIALGAGALLVYGWRRRSDR